MRRLVARGQEESMESAAFEQAAGPHPRRAIGGIVFGQPACSGGSGQQAACAVRFERTLKCHFGVGRPTMSMTLTCRRRRRSRGRIKRAPAGAAARSCFRALRD